MGYSPWRLKESDTTEPLSIAHLHYHSTDHHFRSHKCNNKLTLVIYLSWIWNKYSSCYSHSINNKKFNTWAIEASTNYFVTQATASILLIMTLFSSVQSLSCVWLFATLGLQCTRLPCPSPTPEACLLKLKSIDSVMASNNLILFRPLLLTPSIFPSIRVFSNESVLHIRWPKYCRFSFSINPSNEYSGLISFRINWFEILVVQGTLKSLL